MFKASLRGRILVALLLMLALSIISLCVLLYGTRDALRRGVIQLQAQDIAKQYEQTHDVNALPSVYAEGEMSYSLYSAQGQLLWMSANLEHPRRLKWPVESTNHWLNWSAYSGKVISVPVALANGDILMVAKRDDTERDLIGWLLQERLRYSLMMMLPLVLVGVALIVFLLQWTLRPVRQVAALARDIGPRYPNRRLPLESLPSEIQPLARAANDALDRLAAAYTAERHFVADAAHELRTPLTVLDLRLQLAQPALSDDWPAVTRELSQMRRLVNQLLALARQEGVHLNTPAGDVVSLSKITREVSAALLPLFEQKQRTLALDLQEAVYCIGSADLLREALQNLIENALNHGAGRVRVRLYTVESWAHWEVDDQGEGIPEADQESMFQRFRKQSSQSEGCGLGLAIVRKITQNHDGSVMFVAGHLSRVRIVLPIVSS